MATNKPVFALIGKGKWGQNFITTISQSSDWSLPSENIKTTDYADLFNKKIDGVIIATPTQTHFQIANVFLEKGFNILIEKPITKTYSEALKLQKIVSKHPKQIAMAGHIQLYNPGFILLKSLLPRIGSVKALEYFGLQSPVRTDATVIEDWGPHPTYLFMDFLKKEPYSVKAIRKKRGQIKLTYNFGNITGNAYIAWNSEVKKRQLVILGSVGKIVLDDLSKTVALIKNTGSRIYPIDRRFSPLKMELSEFTTAIRNHRQPKSDIKQAVAVMKIVEKLTGSLSP